VSKGTDEILRDALRKAYLARAKLFVHGIRTAGYHEILQFLSRQQDSGLKWNCAALGISGTAFKKVAQAGIRPHLIFCHPSVLEANPKALLYYRNLSALSNKGLNQMLAGLKGERRERARVELLNGMLSAIIEDMAAVDLEMARAVIPAEIGSELQGTWVNIIGKGAADRVEKLIDSFADGKKLVKSRTVERVSVGRKKKTYRKIDLHNGWCIIFGDEPDVAIRDRAGTLRVAIEIKGSMDKAGAQTRYGEAKKSFAKALKEYAQCETIYLASCFTESVMEQIMADAQVRKIFNLIEIMAEEKARREFLREIFVHQIRVLRGL
jgi:hypothetical protein